MILRGRSQEMAGALAVVNATARTRRGSLVLLTGEAGIGKSAVLDAIGHKPSNSIFLSLMPVKRSQP